VRLGELFQGRFLPTQLLEEQSNLRVYSVRIDSGQDSWILREFFATRRPDAEALSCADRVAFILESGRAGLPRLDEWFEWNGCIYAIEPGPPEMNLALRAQDGPLEEAAASKLFWQMVTLLEGFGSDPAIYHGAIHPTNIALSEDGTVTELSAPAVLFDVIDSLRPPSAGDSLARDLPAAGFAILSALSGQTASALAADSEARQKVLSELAGKDLALALDWVTIPGGGPQSFADLRQFRDRLCNARAEWQKRNWPKAREWLNAARKVLPSVLIQSLLDKLAREEAEHARQAAPAAPAEPKPNPPMSAGGAAATRPAAAKPQKAPPVAPSAVTTRPLLTWGTIIVLALVGWRIYSPNTSAFENEIQSGRLVGGSPSAYALYRSEPASSRTASRMRELAHQHLTRYSDETFQEFHRTASLKNTDWRKCLQAHEWLKEIEPENREFAARLFYAGARVALGDKRNDLAIRHFESALSIRPNWDLAVLGKGIAYLRSGDERKAEQYYLQTARISPDWVFPRMNLAEMYLLQTQRGIDRLPAAEAQAREAVRCDGARPAAVELLGRTLYLRQNYREACRVLGRAMELARNRETRLDVGLVERRRQSSCERAGKVKR
jgi:tetratricopeptide (TPR) repeat protein